MRTFRFATRLVAAGALVVGALGVAAVAPAGADPAVLCASGSGIVHVSPGVTNTPHAQTVGLAGELTGCGGGVKGAIGVRFARTPAVTCSQLEAGGGSLNGRFAVKWLAKHSGRSTGTLTATLGVGGAVHITGTINKGVEAGTSFSTDAQLTPLFKAKGTPCTEANKLQWLSFALTSPVTSS